jgi:hypothetical protein
MKGKFVHNRLPEKVDHRATYSREKPKGVWAMLA